jgi:hypothetical protein
MTSEEDWTIYSLGFETQTTTEFTDDGVIFSNVVIWVMT